MPKVAVRIQFLVRRELYRGLSIWRTTAFLIPFAERMAVVSIAL